MRGILFFIVLLGLQCSPPIVFTEPQPRDTESQARFEFHYQGNFLCSSDSSLVVINNGTVYKEKSFTFVATKAELEDSGRILYEGDAIYVDQSSLPIEVLYQDDSLLAGNLILRDTLFQVGPNQVLKYFKGYEILNIKTTNNQWDVWLLEQDYYGNLVLSRTILPEDILDLKSITAVKDLSTSDLTQYQLSPSKIEFRKLLSKKLIFESCDHFERVGRTVIYN